MRRHLSKEEAQRLQRHMRGSSAKPAIREKPIKTTLRFLLAPVTGAIVNKSTKTKCS